VRFVWTCYRGCTPGDIRADLIRAKGARRLPPRSQRQPGSHQPRPVPADQRDYIIGIIIDPDLTPADAKLHIAVEMLPGGKMPLCRKELDDLAPRNPHQPRQRIPRQVCPDTTGVSLSPAESQIETPNAWRDLRVLDNRAEF
jgi:hypothetical protein